MTRCFPITFCLSSLLFIRTMDRLAEVSDAKMTKSFPVIPNETGVGRQRSDWGLG